MPRCFRTVIVRRRDGFAATDIDPGTAERLEQLFHREIGARDAVREIIADIGVVPATTAERHAKTMAIHRIELTDEWALRKLTICVRRQDDLPLYAQALVRHLASPE